MGLMLGRWRRDRRLLNEVMMALEDVSNDLATLRAQVASVRAKQAVSARETGRASRTPEQELLEESLGGRLVGSIPKGSSILEAVLRQKGGDADGH